MRFANATDVHRALDYPFLIEAFREAHRGPHPDSDHILQSEPGGGDNQFLSLAAWKRGAGIAVKMVGVFPGNLALNPPQASVQGLVALFDPSTGAPRLVADGEAMTFRKTAADSGLGSSLLARPDAGTLLVVGAGGLAPHVLEAHRAARPSIDRVLIWNRTAARAKALADRTDIPGVRVEATEDLDGATAAADIIACVTMSREALVKGALLKPGAHLDLVGAYMPEMRETDDEALTRGTVFADTRHGMERAGELAQAVASGALQWSDVVADFYALTQGKHPGRTSADEITVFKNIGGGHLDLFTAIALMERLSAPAAAGRLPRHGPSPVSGQRFRCG